MSGENVNRLLSQLENANVLRNAGTHIIVTDEPNFVRLRRRLGWNNEVLRLFGSTGARSDRLFALAFSPIARSQPSATSVVI